MTSVQKFKLRNKNSAGHSLYVQGYAESITSTAGSIIIRNRYTIIATVNKEGSAVETIRHVSDLRLPANNWAVWSWPVSPPSDFRFLEQV